MSDTTLYLLIGLAPAAVGAMLALINSMPVNERVERVMVRMFDRFAAARTSDGKINNYLVMPFLFCALKLVGYAYPIRHAGLRSGTMNLPGF